MGLYLLGKEGGSEEGRYYTRRRELPRVARRSSNIVLCYKPGTRWRTGDGGRGVDRKGLDGRRDRTAGFLILQNKGFVDKSPKVYTQLAREGVVLTQDSDNI